MTDEPEVETLADVAMHMLHPDRRERQKQRLAALLLTLPGWNRNYTASLDAAGWLIREANDVGWVLAAEDKP